MAFSKCIKCDNTTFEMKEAKITGSNFRMMFVQCSRCGGVVGVTEFTNTAATLHNISKKLGI
ncbi:hypothetical protein C7A10_29715 [Pseudomonas fluorescens]|uniref:Uncharacterized protein n=1 Tax=Pseudomonas fluorescens TaxID=294 RepID=A0A2T0HLU7_PSEFL|nr:hypothetical protein C7A10_29715 [Pseudomonas fluorescens]